MLDYLFDHVLVLECQRVFDMGANCYYVLVYEGCACENQDQIQNVQCQLLLRVLPYREKSHLC